MTTFRPSTKVRRTITHLHDDAVAAAAHNGTRLRGYPQPGLGDTRTWGSRFHVSAEAGRPGIPPRGSDLEEGQRS
jgi:hypothetical protein